MNSEQVYLWVPVIGHGQVLGRRSRVEWLSEEHGVVAVAESGLRILDELGLRTRGDRRPVGQLQEHCLDGRNADGRLGIQRRPQRA